MAFEPFCSAVDQRFKGFGVVRIDHVDERGVYPAASFDTVKSADDETELHVVAFVFVLNLPVEGSYFDAFHASLDEGGGNLSFRLAYIGFSEEELAVEV